MGEDGLEPALGVVFATVGLGVVRSHLRSQLFLAGYLCREEALCVLVFGQHLTFSIDVSLPESYRSFVPPSHACI